MELSTWQLHPGEVFAAQTERIDGQCKARWKLEDQLKAIYCGKTGSGLRLHSWGQGEMVPTGAGNEWGELNPRDLLDRVEQFVTSSMDAIVRVDNSFRIDMFNPAAERMFGVSAPDAIGKTLDQFIPPRFREAHRRHLREFIESGTMMRALGPNGRVWGLRASGEEFPIEASISQTVSGGQRVLTAFLRDISERFKTEEALRKSEEFSRRVVLDSPVAMAVTTTADEKCVLVNDKYTELFGYTREEVPDASHWWPLAYPDEAYRTKVKAGWYARVGKALSANKPMEPMDAVVQCKDGTQRCVEFHFSSSGDLSLVSFVDITERKAAEGVLSTFSQRLIQAQEEERARIARELHDDINQRLAVVAANLDALAGGTEVSQEARRTVAMVKDIVRDVQGLSHRLHSARLDYLGLAVAAEGLCNELSVRGMRIDFHSEKIPQLLPKEISVCAFRVLQEALQNALKHSGAQVFSVSLTGSAKEIHVVVQDTGCGFDPREAAKWSGLGLIGMRERLRAVDGQLSIESKPQQGTTITARIPIGPVS